MKPRKTETTSRPKETRASAPASPFSSPPRTSRIAPPAAAPASAPREKSEARPASRPAARPAAPAAKPRFAQSRPAQPEKMKEVGACITRRASDRLRAGAVWIYASDIEAIGVPDESNPPALLPVADNRGVLLGTALYSPASQIALRVVAREALDEAQWHTLFEQRLKRSIQRRKAMLTSATDSVRLCFSEADELPGLIIDKYAGLAIVQLLAKGLDTAAIREICTRVLREELRLETILERPDARVCELEGMSTPTAGPLWAGDPEKPILQTEFLLNGLRFQYDAGSGQKTGAFLDQRLNYAAAKEWAKRLGATGRALDVCTYQGGFALHLAEVCQFVTGIDASRASLEVAERNVEANRERLQAEVDWLEADAFQLLRDWSQNGERFDAIVLDPPAFAKSIRAVEGALRGYKELNLRALHMLRPGGLLVSCSCSHHVSLRDLEEAITSAAADAGRRVRLLERRGAAPDHPVVLTLPETEYLKCVILEVE